MSSFLMADYGTGGTTPVGCGYLKPKGPTIVGYTTDGRPIYSAQGAVAACPDSGLGSSGCGKPGFNPVYTQGGPSLYINIQTTVDEVGYVLIVDPIDSGGSLADTQIDVYLGHGGTGYWGVTEYEAIYYVWIQGIGFAHMPN